MIGTNVWLSEMELNKIQKKSKEGENMEKPNIKLQKIYDDKRSHEEVNAELKKI